MPIICPTVTASEPHAYRTQLERVAGLSGRVHLDISDGQFAPHESIDPSALWWPDGVKADIHLMVQQPALILPALILLKPSLIILHAEAAGDLNALLAEIQAAGIRAGLALLATTPVSNLLTLSKNLDHGLIFSGTLGSFGGTVDTSLLTKIGELRSLKSGIEVGWDGGINDDNAARLAAGGVDVLNTGGFIQRAENPAAAYARLEAVLLHS